MKMTNAIRFHDYGGPEVMKLEQIPLPVPQADEILVRVHAMGVNPVDWKVREGLARKRLNIALPAIPGGDISGVIEQIGAAASGVSVGQPVFAMVGLLGAYAEHVAIKPGITAPKPANLDHVQAASVPLAALTAWKGLFELGGLERGHRVLIHAAAGGVAASPCSLHAMLVRRSWAPPRRTTSPTCASSVPTRSSTTGRGRSTRMTTASMWFST
jgi:NADPH:quinone reductase-like Zn-dependent oxidoreductase